METSSYDKFDIFPWNRNFETGVEIIDEQHKKLVEILNRLAYHLIHSSSVIILDSVFDELVEYTNYHFKSEEKYWGEHLKNDSWISNHEKMHKSFIGKVIKLKNQQNKPKNETIQEIVSFLTHWLAFHILDSDKRMAYVVKQLKQGYNAQKAKEYSNEAMSGLMENIIETVLNMYDKLSSRTLDLMREKSLRKKAEQALLVSEERWDFILEGSEESIWEWNLVNEEMSSSLQNSQFFKFLVHNDSNLNNDEYERIIRIHPNDINKVNKELQKHLDGKSDFFTSDYRVLRENNSWSWISSKGKVVERDSNGTAMKMVGTHTDISERELSSIIFQHGYQSIIITDASYQIKNVNPTFSTITGYKGNDALGEDVFDWFFTNDNVFTSDYLKKELLKKGSWQGEVLVHRKDNTELTALTNISSVSSTDNSIEYYVIMFTDISKRKNTEEKLRKAKEKAEESDRLKSAFLANISHEIRTPMNGIMGLSSLLSESNISGENQQEYIRLINLSSQRMQNILKEIVDISMIETGQMDVNLSNTNLNLQLRNIYDSMKNTAREKGLELHLENSIETTEVNILTDQKKLESILKYLLANAIKYTDAGYVKFGYKEIGDFFEFYVEDSGIGIPSNRQRAVFDRFIQADIEDIEARQGAGLGLTITKEFVKMLGGKIWLKSSVGEGSTFYFTIQQNFDSKSQSQNILHKKTGKESEGYNKPRILIVEDDISSQLYLSYLVKNLSKEIITANSGTEALEICKNNNDIDLILMDIQMPEMNGIEATKKIREFNKEVVIIAQTVYILSDDRDKTLEAGCNDFISKPIEKTELLELIDSYFGRS